MQNNSTICAWTIKIYKSSLNAQVCGAVHGANDYADDAIKPPSL